MSMIAEVLSYSFGKRKVKIIGVISIPMHTIKLVKKVRSVNIDERNSLSFPLSSSDLSSNSLNVGIKATVILFSAKRRRRRFGIKKETVKASAKGEVPKNLDFTISLIKPKIREIKVNIVRKEPLLIIDCELVFFSSIFNELLFLKLKKPYLKSLVLSSLKT